MSEYLRIHQAGPVQVVSMTRPGTRNALDTAMLAALRETLDEAASDSQTRAVVLTGSHGTFASGADIAELRDTHPMSYLTSTRRVAWTAIDAFPKPMVAAVTGYALGGGCELALRCDAIVAGDRAVFGQPEVRLGLVAGAGGVQWWTRVVGRYAAARPLLVGERIDAYEARRLGLVSQVVPDEAVLDIALSLASSIAQSGPLAARLTKEMIRGAYEAPLSSALAHDRVALAATLSTEDHVEGMNAVLERRTPHFGGR